MAAIRSVDDLGGGFRAQHLLGSLSGSMSGHARNRNESKMAIAEEARAAYEDTLRKETLNVEDRPSSISHLCLSSSASRYLGAPPMLTTPALDPGLSPNVSLSLSLILSRSCARSLKTQ